MKSERFIHRKNKMKVDIKNTSEYVSKDILDEDFVKSLKPTIYFQMALGSCRVYNKDKFITSPTVYQKLYTILCIVVTAGFHAMVLEAYALKYKESLNLYYLLASAMIVDIVFYVLNIIQLRFLNGDANIDFLIHLQTIDRLMKIEHNSTIIGLMRRITNITLMFFIIIFSAFLVFLIFKGGLINVCYCGIVNSHFTFMLEIANCSNYIYYFIIRLRFVNSIISNHLESEAPKEPSKYLRFVPTKRWIKYTSSLTHNFVLSDTEKYLKAIFDGFKKFQDVYRFQILTFCVKLVILSLITFEFILLGVQNNLLKLVEILSAIMFSSFGYMMILILSVRYEVFFREVKLTKCSSIGILMQYQEGPLRQKAKRMLKMIEESPPCFSVYDMWYMDARISLKLFSLITSLIVTLLQFAFL